MKIMLFLVLAISVALIFCGCAPEAESMGEVVSFSFSRTNGSVWGTHLSISADKNTVYYLAYFPNESDEFITKENLPITEEQWQKLASGAKNAADSMEIKKPKYLKSFINRLFPSPVVDGADNYSFSVEYENDTVDYMWTYTGPGESFIALVESLAPELDN